MKSIPAIVLFIGLLAAATIPAHAGGFIAMAAPYPPYSESNGLSVKGMTVSTLTTIMDKCGTPIADREIKLMPWAYACESAARQPGRILLNANRTQETEHLYKWVGPVATAKIVLIGRKQDRLRIPSRAHLSGYRIATVRWSRPEKNLLAGGLKAEQLMRSPSHVQALRQLGNGDADLFATTELDAPRLLEGLGMRQEDYTVYFVFNEESLYFAFSRDTDDDLIDKLNLALEEIRASEARGTNRFEMTCAQ
ncbi:transporter substrate-binding domain-containing protein [Pseudodesulfovibrio thermohalotolerans]|uniref:substrate-binding periplasmic protein n=1 Tax=Pseudodesulfovibrio thermohalotolerans TaxID=2880651 RepID=UPI002442550B|nr:transporter substrate-binding domain-containing protein [Pseudodesulfovibrio thermohalotolerans]WFS61254.1 transporter substrate-binding domain-containing protein [Pseudodesulfovibrio thermohalotolerans]